MEGNIEKLDAIDLKILSVLQADCHLTTKEVAQKVNLSTTPVFERIKRLEKEGYILKYVAVLDANKLNRGFTVYCNVRLKQINKPIAEEFAKAMRDWDEVSECYNISGEFDFLLKIQAANMKRYQEFVINVLGTLDFLANIQSAFVMDTIKMGYGIPMNHI